MQTSLQVKLHMVAESQTPGTKDAFVQSCEDFFLLKHWKKITNTQNQVNDFPTVAAPFCLPL